MRQLVGIAGLTYIDAQNKETATEVSSYVPVKKPFPPIDFWAIQQIAIRMHLGDKGDFEIPGPFPYPKEIVTPLLDLEDDSEINYSTPTTLEL